MKSNSKMRTMRNLLTPIALLPFLLLAFGAAPPTSGGIEGAVTFTGKVPPSTKVVTMDGHLLHNDLIVEKKTKGLRDVAVSLLDAPVPKQLPKRKPAYVDQKDLVFVPRVTAVLHGQAVRFDNSDGCNHSVVGNSTVKANTFNTFVTQGNPYDHTFEAQRHPVAITCSLHAWMKAYVYVFDHPYFAVTNDKGEFRIPDVPEGKYTLWFRHADTGLNAKREVVVQVGRTTRVDQQWKEVPKD